MLRYKIIIYKTYYFEERNICYKKKKQAWYKIFTSCVKCTQLICKYGAYRTRPRPLH